MAISVSTLLTVEMQERAADACVKGKLYGWSLLSARLLTKHALTVLCTNCVYRLELGYFLIFRSFQFPASSQRIERSSNFLLQHTMLLCVCSRAALFFVRCVQWRAARHYLIGSIQRRLVSSRGSWLESEWSTLARDERETGVIVPSRTTMGWIPLRVSPWEYRLVRWLCSSWKGRGFRRLVGDHAWWQTVLYLLNNCSYLGFVASTATGVHEFPSSWLLMAMFPVVVYTLMYNFPVLNDGFDCWGLV